MVTTPFGEHLRREREMRGVSLEEISTATRISVRFLEALESERWDDLPGGIFNRGFIRAMAHFLGLDEESLIAEYALTTNDKPEVAVWTNSGSAPRRWLLPLLVLLVLALLAAGGWFGYRRFGPMVKSWRKPGKSPAIQSPTSQPPGPPLVASGAKSPASAASSDPAESNPALLELKVQAGKPTLVKVVADGRTIFNGKFAADQSRLFKARDRFDVTSSEASALVLELNSQIQPPLGPPGQPGSITLTRKDVKLAQGGRD
jgi:cytoskeletal protein RodZ